MQAELWQLAVGAGRPASNLSKLSVRRALSNTFLTRARPDAIRINRRGDRSGGLSVDSFSPFFHDVENYFGSPWTSGFII